MYNPAKRAVVEATLKEKKSGTLQYVWEITHKNGSNVDVSSLGMYSIQFVHLFEYNLYNIN